MDLSLALFSTTTSVGVMEDSKGFTLGRFRFLQHILRPARVIDDRPICVTNSMTSLQLFPVMSKIFIPPDAHRGLSRNFLDAWKNRYFYPFVT